MRYLGNCCFNTTSKIIFFCCLVMGTATIQTWSQSSSSSSPRLVCDNPELDFGNKSRTNIIHHVFIIKNAGDAPLMISRVHACCGAETRLTLNSVPAQTNTIFEITLSLSGRIGPMHKSIYIHSNDQANPIFQLRIKGNILAP